MYLARTVSVVVHHHARDGVFQRDIHPFVSRTDAVSSIVNLIEDKLKAFNDVKDVGPYDYLNLTSGIAWVRKYLNGDAQELEAKLKEMVDIWRLCTNEVFHFTLDRECNRCPMAREGK